MADKLVVTVTSVAVSLRTPSSGQENQIVVNAGPATVYLGQTSGVTTALGLPFPAGSEAKIYKNGLPIFAIAAAGTAATLQISPGIQAT